MVCSSATILLNKAGRRFAYPAWQSCVHNSRPGKQSLTGKSRDLSYQANSARASRYAFHTLGTVVQNARFCSPDEQPFARRGTAFLRRPLHLLSGSSTTQRLDD